MKLHLPTGLRAAIVSLFATIAVGTLGTTTLHATELADAVLSLDDFSTTSISSAVSQGWIFSNITTSGNNTYISNGTQATIDKTSDWATLVGSNRTLWSVIVTVDAASLENLTSSNGYILQQQDNGSALGVGYTSGDKATGIWRGAPNGTAVNKLLADCEDNGGNITLGLSYAGDTGTTIFVVDGMQKVSSQPVGGLKGGYDADKHPVLTLTPANGLEYKSLYIFGDVVSAADMQKMMQSLVDPLPIEEYVWSGAPDTAAWDTSSHNWEGSAVYKNSNANIVTFGNGSVAKTVTVGESIQAGTVNVNDNYTFNVSSTGSLGVAALNVTAGKKATFAGAGAITLGSFTGPIGIAADTTVSAPSEINLASGSTLDVSGEGTLNTVTLKVAGGTAQIASNLNVSGGGTGEGSGNNSKGLALTGDNGTANITDGVTNVTGAVYSNGNNIALNVGQGEQYAVLVANRLELGDRNGGAGTFVIGAHGKVVVKSSNDATDYKNAALLLSEWNQSISAQIDGELYARDAWLSTGDAATTINVAGTLAVKGIRGLKGTGNKIYFNEGGKLVLGGSGLAAGNGTWTIAFTGAEIGTYADSTELARNFTISDNVTFNTAMYTWTGENATLDLQEGTTAGTITVSGNITGDGTITKAGVGSLTLAGTENVIAHAITLQQGELVLSGTFDVSALATGGGGETKYVDGEVEGNGFLAHDELTAQVVNIATGATVSGEGTFTADGSVGTFNTATGTATFAAGASYTTLYVNVAGKTEGLAHAVAKAGDQLTTVILKDGTTLAADAAVTLPTLTVAENASAEVALSKDLTVTALTITTDDETLTLSGTGNITVGSLTGAGNLAYGSTGVMTLNGSNTGFTGDVTITNGTLKVGNEKALGEYGSQTKTITVGDGGTLDLNGTRDSNFSYILAGGTLTNTGADMGTSLSQTVGLQLTKDSTVEAFSGKQYWLRARGGNSTTLTLDGNTLVKTGDGTFGVFRCTVGTGTIEVRGGDFKFDTDGSTAANITFNGGTVTGSMKLSDDITLKALQKAASAANINADSHAITLDGTEELTLTGNISNATGITKTGTGTAVLSGTVGASPAINVNAGTLKATKAGALGSGAVNVAADATLDLAVDGILAGTQTVTSAGNVVIHTTLTQGKIDGGVLTLAGDFPVDGTLKDVDGKDTGNGFSQGGSMHIVEDRAQQLSGITSIIRGDTTYTLDNVSTDGYITMAGADWSIYQLKVENDAQPTIQAIMDYADEKGSGTGVLKQIVVTGEGLSLVDDSKDFKTSMLGGDKQAYLFFAIVDDASLKMDADLGTVLQYASEGGEAEIVMEKDAAMAGGIWAYTAEGGVANLTVKGDYTLSLPDVSLMHGKLILQDSANMAAETLDMAVGDSVVVKGDSEFTLPTVSIQSVDGTKDAVLKMETADPSDDPYDTGKSMYSITDARVTINYSVSGSALNFGNAISGDVALVNAGTSSVNDTNAANTAYAELHAQKGDIYLSNKTSGVSVNNLKVDTGRTVSMLQSDNIITVKGEASFGEGAKVSSALTMANGSTLEGKPASLESHALVLGAAAGDKLNIGDTLWGVLSGLEPEGTTSLFTNVNALTLAGQGYAGPVDLTTIFSREGLNANKYSLSYDNDTVIVTRNKDNDRYWKGGNGTWNTTDNYWFDQETGGTAVNFVNGYNAHFTSAGGVITLGEDNIVADSVYVAGTDGADYIFDPNGHTLTVTDSVEVSGDHTATFNMGLVGDKLKLTVKNDGVLELNAGGDVNAVELEGGTVSVGSGTLTTDSMTVNGSSIVDGGTISTAALSGTGTLVLGGCTLTFTSSTDLTGAVDLQIVHASTLATSGEGVTLKLKTMIENASEDTVTFTGTFDLSNLTATEGETKYVEGEITGNGFKQAQKTIEVVSGGSANGTAATLLYKGQDIGKMNEEGVVTFAQPTDYSTFYVNKNTEKVSTALGKFSSTPGTFVLADATTLEVDENIAMSMVNVATDKSATMLIDADKTVTTDGTAKTGLTLKGSGELAVDPGKTTTGVTLDDHEWKGTVSFKDVQLTELDSDWGAANSTVALQNASGTLGNTIVDYALELRKTDENNKWGFGTSTGGDNFIAGVLKGDGDLGVREGSAATTFTLNGSTDDWNGNFVDNSSGEVVNSLTLYGAAKTIHGTVGGMLDAEGKPAYAANLYVETSVDTTFEKAVMAEALVVSGTTNLKESSTIGILSAGSGSLSLAANQTLTIRESMVPGTKFSMGAGSKVVLEEDSKMGDANDQGLLYVGGTDGATITHSAEEQQTYSLGNEEITVDGAKLQFSSYKDVVVNNVLKNISADNLDLNHSLELNNVTAPLTVGTSLSIADGKTFKVAVANGAARQNLVMGADSTLTTAAGSVADANLIVNSGVTLNMAGTLNLNGGALTLNKGITLSGNLFDQLAAIKTAGDSVTLFSNVGTLTLAGTSETTGVDATLYFTHFMDELEGDYAFKYEDGNLSIVYSDATSRQLVWDGTDTENRWVAYEPETIDPEVKDWYQPSTEQGTHFANGDTATFDSTAENTQVVISGEIEAKKVTVKDGAEYEFFVEGLSEGTLAVTNQMKVMEESMLAKTGEGDLVLDLEGALEVDGSTLAVDEGSLYIGTLDKDGALKLTNAEVSIAQGATLSVNAITGDTDTTINMDGMLIVDGGSIQSLTAGENSTLTINDGTLSIASATKVYNLVNTGTLDLGSNDLTIASTTEYGGNVTAGTLHLAENGSNFGNLKVNTIHYAYDKEGAGTLDYVEVSTIGSNGAEKITLDMTDVRGEGGSLAPIQRTSSEITYTLVSATDQALNAEDFTLDSTTQKLLVQNGLIQEGAGLEVNEDNAGILQLTIGGLDLTWNTSKDETEWGYKVVDETGALTDGANTLNGVQHVLVDEDRTVDVTGVGSEPGLRVRNLAGLAGRTITFSGEEGDTVNLITTEETASNVNLAAENITVKVGLDELDGMDPEDYKDLRVGDVDLTGATLAVHSYEDLDAAFTVNTLSGDDESTLKGRVIVEGQGGEYFGGYENAYVILHENAEQTLAAGEGLTVAGLGAAKLAYVGPETHMDGIEGIDMTVTLNDPKQDNSGATLVLDKPSWLVDGTIISGMSAIKSGATLDTAEAPNLIQAAGLNLDGTTIILNQDAVDDSVMAMAVNGNGKTKGLYLAHLGAEDSNTDRVLLNGYLYNKYYQNARLEGGKLLVDRRDAFFTEDVVRPTTVNGRAGAGMLDDALLEINPQATNPQGDLAAVMTALETNAVANPDRVAAAVAGASAAALGHAFNNDVQRQLRAIRNRTTTMGLAECVKHEGLPYVNAWVNAEGDYRKLDADGTLAGYTLSSWGGTIGCDVDLTGRLTVGAAFTVLHGEFTSHSADMCEGDLDRDYVSLFARYGYRAWTHTFVATLGFAKSKVDRTVNYGTGSYTTRGDSNGNAFGFLYEVGYTKALNEDASTCLQPIFNVNYRHSSLGGYTEKGSDAALSVGSADMDAVTFGLGARLQSIVGTSVYNRATLFEGRVLAKLDAGDRDCTTNSSLIGVSAKRSVKSAEVGAFGVEVGAGLTIPVGETGGSIFMDVTGDFRSGYTEFNGTVGYRFSF